MIYHKSSRNSFLEKTRATFAKCDSRELFGHKDEVHSVAWNCTGKKLASGSIDNTARTWCLGHSGKDLELKGHTGSVHQLTWHPTDPQQLVTASADKTVKLWDARTGKCPLTVPTSGGNINITWSPDGNYIAVGNKEDRLSIIDARKGSVIKSVNFNFEVNEISWNPGTDQLFVATGRGDVQIMNWPAMESFVKLEANTANCYCLKFSPNGKYFAVGGADALASVWDLDDLICIRTFDRLECAVRAVSFSHDSKFIAMASEDSHIDISDIESGELLHKMSCGTAINTMAWHPRLHWLAFATSNKRERNSRGSIHIWGFTQ